MIEAVNDVEEESALAALHARCAGAGTVAGSVLLRLPAGRPPWQPTGLELRAGQAYSVFARGRVQWAPGHPELHGGPRFHLWLRVTPGGRIRNLRADSDSFVADVDGELEACIHMGMWRDDRGALATGPELHARLSGGLEALVIAWQTTASEGLEDLGRDCPSRLLTAEATRLAAPDPTPAGWHALLETGESRLFSTATTPAGTPAIAIAGEDDQGILCRDVDFPLLPDTRLSWAWRLDAHPSALPEDSTRAHDYISIATEFDNGRDLTWFWSVSLPPGHHFPCPVKAWSARETHLVARSGTTGLGAWQREERAVWQDVASAMGPPPARIVRIWLIAVASFQHGRLRASFSDIRLRSAGRELEVL